MEVFWILFNAFYPVGIGVYFYSGAFRIFFFFSRACLNDDSLLIVRVVFIKTLHESYTPWKNFMLLITIWPVCDVLLLEPIYPDPTGRDGKPKPKEAKVLSLHSAPRFKRKKSRRAA